MKKLFLIAMIIAVVLSTSRASIAVFYPIRYDGPYKGKVVDAETGKPIEGVVVLGVWSKQLPTAAGGVSKYYAGMGLKIFSILQPMDVLIFKAGYEHIGLWPWESFKIDENLKKKIGWESEKAIIPLKKLTMEERNKRLFGKENIPDEKQKLLIRELNKERVDIGLTPYREVK